jgi:hypothetical protein
MGPFGSDFGGIEDLFNHITRENSEIRNQTSQSSGDIFENIISKTGTYIILDFSSKKIEEVEIKDNLEENEYGEEVHDGQKVLVITFGDGTSAKYTLPKKFKRNKLDWTEKNGILEVLFKK